MQLEIKDQIARRWGVAPDDAINYATIPSVQARAQALAGEPIPSSAWTSPYPPGITGGPGPFSIILDAVHPPDRPIQRLLSLCCGHGHAERAFAHARTVHSCDALDISPSALAQARSLAAAAGLSGINYRTHDINQLALTGTYDFAFAAGLHHIERLEHVCAEVRDHLAPGAPFMLYEYVGPSRCQYPPRQVETINACIRLLPERLRVRVTSQRELGAASSEEAYDMLRRQSASIRQARVIAADVFPVSRVNRHCTARIERLPDGIRVTTTPRQWEYAASFEAAEPMPDDQANLVLIITGQVKEGQIGVGCVATDLTTYLQDEVTLTAGPATTWRIPMLQPEACHSVVFRNVNAAGASVIEVHQVALALMNGEALPGGEEQSLEHDREFTRHFWTAFVPMSVEQWLATDPSESVRSSDIVPVLRATFRWVDVRYMRGSLLQFVLHDLAANFYGRDDAASRYLDLLFHIEDVVMAHDAVPENYAYIVASDRDLSNQNSV